MHMIGKTPATTAVPFNESTHISQPSRPGSGTITLHQKTGPNAETSTAGLANATATLFDGKGRASSALEAKGMAPEGSIRHESSATRKRGGFANRELLASIRQQVINEQLPSQATRSDLHTGRSRANAAVSAELKTQLKREALVQLQREVMKIDLSGSPRNVMGTFLRQDSMGQKMIKSAVFGEFQAPAQQLMDGVFAKLQTSMASLGPNVSMIQIDHALTEAYQTMISGFKAIDFPQSLKEASKVISSSLDDATRVQTAVATSDMQQQMRTLSADLKSGIKKTLLLRLFVPHVLEYARGVDFQREEMQSKAAVDSLNGWLQSHPQARLSGFTISKLANILISSINGASGLKYDDLASHFPTLVKTMKEHKLNV